MSWRPLDGVRVLDICRLIPGGLATRRLADLGADVVKVEEPGRGDYLRTIPPTIGGVGLMHAVLNRGKRSIALDLKSADGREQLERLADRADVIVEVSRPGSMEGMGIDFAALRRMRPELVVCSITGYGQEGPLASLPSHGMNMDAWAGCLPITWDEGRPRIGGGEVALSVELGGLNAALAVTAAVYQSRTIGRGEWLDISCWDAGVEANRLGLAHRATTGEPLVSISDLGPLYDTYVTSDGQVIMFAAIEEKFWTRFCEGVGRPDLLTVWDGDDVDFGTNEALYKKLADVFRSESAEIWAARFVEWGVPGSVVLDIAGVLRHPHLRERGLACGTDESGIEQFASPIRSVSSGERANAVGLAPTLGQHTAEVLTDWLN